MGNRCSDLDQKPAKPLDAESSNEDNDGPEQEEGEEEEGEDDELEEDKAQTEKTLNEGLQRGKTSAFKDAIDHATALGLEESTINKAEKRLEDHKATRKREAFEQELTEFMKSDGSNDIPACEKMIAQGKDCGVDDKVLRVVHEKIADLELRKPLRPEELEQAKQFLELCTRRFVASCIKGRQVKRLDLEGGDEQDATISLDLTLKNFSIAYNEQTEKFKFADVTVNRAADTEDVANSDVFGELNDDQKNSAVAIVPGSGDAICILEASKAKQDEFVCGCTVLLGVGVSSAKKKEKTKSSKDKKDKSPKEGLKDAAAAEEAPPAPETSKSKSPKEETKAEEGEKKRDSKKRGSKGDPPPPPPPAEEPEDEGSEPASNSEPASGSDPEE